MVSLPGLRNRKVVPQRTAGELDAMAAAGALVAAALAAVRQAAAPGVSTLDLDEIAEAIIRDGGRHPVLPGLSRVSRHHLLVGQRPSGARHPVGRRDTGAR